MSLSFVSKTVQTSTSDGAFEEKAIESAEAADDDKRGGVGVQKPLFEQLRHNKEQDDEQREEFQRSLMRGTLALDEEDAAHLTAVEQSKQQKQSKVHKETLDELTAFRAAQADRMEQQAVVVAEEPAVVEAAIEVAKGVAVVAMKPSLPTRQGPSIIVKNRRRKVEGGVDGGKGEPDKKAKVADSSESEPKEMGQKKSSDGLGGLLTGYGSSSDDD
jgi:hypothetical protein